VGYTDIAEGDGMPSATDVYDGKREEFRQAQAEIEREGDVYVGNLLGREYAWHSTTEGITLTGLTRVYLKGQRLYLVGFWAPDSSIDHAAMESARQFLGSFRFVD
jgi:hypothetical protein